jgi:hypothetical protein
MQHVAGSDPVVEAASATKLAPPKQLTSRLGSLLPLHIPPDCCWSWRV